MFEIKIMIEAPELSGAMMRLADAISAKPAGPAVHSPTAPAAPAEPAPAAPAKKETKKEAKPAPAKAEKPAPAPKPEPVKAAEPATAPAPAAAAAPAPQPAPAPAPQPASAVAPAPTTQPEAAIDLSVIARAGAGLVDQGKMPEIMNLLKNYNVRAITELKQEQYADFAKDLRALGAAI